MAGVGHKATSASHEAALGKHLLSSPWRMADSALPLFTIILAGTGWHMEGTGWHMAHGHGGRMATRKVQGGNVLVARRQL